MNEPKIYAPATAKQIETNYGPLLKVSFSADKMILFINTHRNERGYVNLTISNRKEVGKYGDTHSVALDTWKPKTQAGSGSEAP